MVELMDHPDARYVGTLENAERILLEQVQPGDVVITLGAGDGYLIGERILKKLNNQAGGK
jgi:UDP-N-acetylmuramate--alanine ligase